MPISHMELTFIIFILGVGSYRYLEGVALLFKGNPLALGSSGPLVYGEVGIDADAVPSTHRQRIG